jgi:hypothetical protein
MDAVRDRVSDLDESDLDFLHRFLFKRVRKPPKSEVLPNILDFSGYLTNETLDDKEVQTKTDAGIKVRTKSRLTRLFES